MGRIRNLVLDTYTYDFLLIISLMLGNVIATDLIIDPLLKLFVLWGIFIISIRFIKKDYDFRIGEIIILIFLLFSLITIGINWKSNLYYNLVHFSFTLCFILINFKHERVDLYKIYRFNNIYVYIVLILSILSLGTYVLNVPIDFAGNHYGVYWDVFYGLYINPNTGSIINVFAIFLLFFNFYLDKKNYKLTTKKKSIYVTIAIVLGIYLYFADSRGSQLVLLSFISLLVLYKLIISNKGILHFSLFAIAFIISIYVVISSPKNMVNSFIGEIFNNSSQVIENVPITEETSITNPSDSEIVKNTPSAEESPITNPSDPETVDNSKNSDISSARFTLWKGGIKAFVNSPLLGVGPVNVLDTVKKFEPSPAIAPITAGGVHNQYIDLLVSTGFAGLLLFVFGIAIIILNPLKKLVIEKRSLDIILGAMIISLLVGNLVETSLVFTIFITTGFFWFLIGLYNNISSEGNEKK